MLSSNWHVTLRLTFFDIFAVKRTNLGPKFGILGIPCGYPPPTKGRLPVRDICQRTKIQSMWYIRQERTSVAFVDNQQNNVCRSHDPAPIISSDIIVQPATSSNSSGLRRSSPVGGATNGSDRLHTMQTARRQNNALLKCYCCTPIRYRRILPSLFTVVHYTIQWPCYYGYGTYRLLSRCTQYTSLPQACTVGHWTPYATLRLCLGRFFNPVHSSDATVKT